MQARLALINGEARPNVVDLTPEKPISIGRSRDNSIVLPQDEQASRLHARVYFEDGRWLLRDFGLNGTRIDESRVNQVAELADGSEIRIGEVKFRFVFPDAAASQVRATAVTRVPVVERQTVAEGHSVPLTSTRFSTEELTALSQFMQSVVEAKDPHDLARVTIQALFYQTGAAFAGLFTLDPTDPLPKIVWPDTAPIDEHMARQLTRRVQRDNRLVWMAEDTCATIPSSGVFTAAYADALALPLKAGGKALGALHLYKGSGYFSDRDRKYTETAAAFAGKVLGGLMARRVLEAETARLKGLLADDELVGDSPAMVALRGDLARVAAHARPVLFRGEPGCGKESAAHEAHRRGARSDAPFVVIRCGNTPAPLLEAELFGYRKGAFSGADRDFAGYIAMADGGTLFIDEVADLQSGCQARLAHLLESRKYRPQGATYDIRADIKLMAATRHDLAAEVTSGKFRSDLLSALKGAEVVVPPLRAHAEDIPHLAQFFLDRIGADWRREWSLSPGAMRYLRERPWPGNVRQLRSVLEHAASTATGDIISEIDLAAVLR